MLTNGDPNFSLLLAVNIWKSLENCLLTHNVEFNTFLIFNPPFLTFSTLVAKKVISPWNSGHWPLIKIWNLAHSCSDCKKVTLKTKWVKDESQNWILAKINIFINVFFLKQTYFLFCQFLISVIFSKTNWNISFRNIKMSKYRWTFPFD